MNASEQARQRGLQSYLLRAVLAAQDDLAPELIDMAIGGSTEAEIDQSIEVAKAKSAALVSRMLQGQVAPRQAPAAGPAESDAALAQRVAAMGVEEYARHRELLGTAPRTMIDFLGGS